MKTNPSLTSRVMKVRIGLGLVLGVLWASSATAVFSSTAMGGVAADPISQRFLLVYQQANSGSPIEVFGQFAGLNNELIESPFVIASGSRPAVVFDRVNLQFMVAYQVNGGLSGHLVNADGTLFGSQLHLDEDDNPDWSEFDDRQAASLTYDSVNHRFLVVWRNLLSSNFEVHIEARILDGEGSYLGPKVDIPPHVSQTILFTEKFGMAFDPDTQTYLVTWKERRPLPTKITDIYGHLLNADGSLQGTTIAIDTFPN